MKIFDTFTFFNELDILELRLNILNDYVDQFILVEATKSHQNNPKPLYFKDNIERFEKFLPKIKHIIVDNFPEYSYWSHENHQRDIIYQSLKELANENDIIFVSDVDEIWNPKELFPLLNNIKLDKIHRWRSRICYFYFNLIAHKEDWVQPMFLNFSLLRNLIEKDNLKLSYDIFHNQSQRLRSDIFLPTDSYCGWHFSFTESPIYKLQNYLHPEFKHLTEEDINKCIKNKINPFYQNQMEIIEH
jgi:beta-1,4-mannosyl-glycoprotein beta-1,4-N-acetylglucosaminyltransferase